MKKYEGSDIYNLAKQLWPINRSLTGDGVRHTLAILKEILPRLNIFEVPSGTSAFDWTVPKEWQVKDAYIVAPSGNRICSFKENNLHLLGYSAPINKVLSLSELQSHLHSLPEQPDAIPYVTSYYKENWGFCISHDEREKLVDGDYQVVIESRLFTGSLTYGELIIPGTSEKEVFLSTYICHPSMANNELSGPAVTTFLAKWLSERESNKYTYRIIFIPETIGSIVYLSKNLEKMKANIYAGFNVSCVGDDRAFSYLPSRNGNTISDAVAQHVLKHLSPNYISYQWKDRGSDERQYCAPHIDLPVVSIMRTKYCEYPEYHTSLDTLGTVVTEQGLSGSFNAIKLALEVLEKNIHPTVKVLCEPQLSKRGLYPTLSTKDRKKEVGLMMDLITWSDGSKSLLEIAEICHVPIWELYPLLDLMVGNELISITNKQ